MANQIIELNDGDVKKIAKSFASFMFGNEIEKVLIAKKFSVEDFSEEIKKAQGRILKTKFNFVINDSELNLNILDDDENRT